MFTGIIENTGIIDRIDHDGANVHIWISSVLALEAYIDQSISHNGVCLTVVDIAGSTYKVTAVHETLSISNLKYWKPGDMVNLERSMLPHTRLDGHFVQGHVDCITQCIDIKDANGSWYFTFKIPLGKSHLMVNKGSIAINGTSLTLIINEALKDTFQVAIIPYTFQHTNFQHLKPGDNVNIEFDILGKYVERMMEMRNQK